MRDAAHVGERRGVSADRMIIWHQFGGGFLVEWSHLA